MENTSTLFEKFHACVLDVLAQNPQAHAKKHENIQYAYNGKPTPVITGIDISYIKGRDIDSTLFIKRGQLSSVDTGLQDEKRSDQGILTAEVTESEEALRICFSNRPSRYETTEYKLEPIETSSVEEALACVRHLLTTPREKTLTLRDLIIEQYKASVGAKEAQKDVPVQAL